MKPLPLPVRVAAGLAVTAVDRARHLPEKLAELPVTMVSQALQLSMRLQQQVTELAIKGDDVLSTFRPVEESPEWATFDEDSANDQYDASPINNGTRSRFDTVQTDAVQNDDVTADLQTDGLQTADVPTDSAVAEGSAGERDPWAAEEQAMRHELDDHVAPADADDQQFTDAVADAVAGADAPAALPSYGELTLPQVRARMRRLDADQLAELLDYERTHGDRPAFVGMLTRRLAALRDQQ
jgi:hypothetical protein